MTFPQICLCSSDVDQLVANQGEVQWVEWRSDLFGFDVSKELDQTKVLWTYRTPEETSHSHESLKALIQALHKHALVDMQLLRDHTLIRSLRFHLQQKIMVSYHGAFEGLEVLKTRINQMRLFPRVRYWKLALDFSKNSLQDLCECLKFIRALPDDWQKKIVFIPIGIKWTAFRLWSSSHLGDFLFSCYSEKTALGAGQPDLDVALAYQRHVQKEAVYALLGSTVGQSPSHLSHNRLLSQMKQGARYLKISLEDNEFSDFLKQASNLGICGFSVTIPHKERALELAASSTELARAVGAANLLCHTPQGWHADNTDARAFNDLFDIFKIGPSTKALVLGAGGSAKAAIATLMKRGCAINIVTRSQGRADQIKNELSRMDPFKQPLEVYTFADEAWKGQPYDIIVQSTPLGRDRKDKYPFLFEELCSKALLIELVNGPSRESLDSKHFEPTELSQYWQVKGWPVVHAEEFFIRQASYQFQAWFGFEPQLGYDLLKAFFHLS